MQKKFYLFINSLKYLLFCLSIHLSIWTPHPNPPPLKNMQKKFYLFINSLNYLLFCLSIHLSSIYNLYLSLYLSIQIVAGSHELGQDYEHVTLLIKRFSQGDREHRDGAGGRRHLRQPHRRRHRRPVEGLAERHLGRPPRAHRHEEPDARRVQGATQILPRLQGQFF